MLIHPLIHASVLEASRSLIIFQLEKPLGVI